MKIGTPESVARRTLIDIAGPLREAFGAEVGDAADALVAQRLARSIAAIEHYGDAREFVGQMHLSDLRQGESRECAGCDGLLRGSARIGLARYCCPTCDCHPDCYRAALLTQSPTTDLARESA